MPFLIFNRTAHPLTCTHPSITATFSSSRRPMGICTVLDGYLDVKTCNYNITSGTCLCITSLSLSAWPRYIASRSVVFVIPFDTVHLQRGTHDSVSMKSTVLLKMFILTSLWQMYYNQKCPGKYLICYVTSDSQWPMSASIQFSPLQRTSSSTHVCMWEGQNSKCTQLWYSVCMTIGFTGALAHSLY